MSTFLQHVKKVAEADIRLFFAPFVGAIDGIKKELNRRDSEPRSSIGHHAKVKQPTK